MKVLFLDVDGVLNPNRRRDTPSSSHLEKWLWPDRVALLKGLVDRTRVKICVSSTWRLGRGYRELVRHFVFDHGFRPSTFVGRTPDHRAVIGTTVVADRRGAEIAEWLRAHPAVTRFVILDDDADMGALLPHLIQTQPDVGLTAEHVELAVRRLEAA